MATTAVAPRPVSAHSKKRAASTSPLGSPSLEGSFRTQLPIATARRQKSNGNLKRAKEHQEPALEVPRAPSELSLAESARARRPKGALSDYILDEELHHNEGQQELFVEDHLEDLVNLPISDELLPTRLRTERIREAASASSSTLASSLVFGLRPSKSTGALELLNMSRQASVDDLSLSRATPGMRLKEESLGPAIPGSVAYGISSTVSTSSIALSRSSSSQSSGNRISPTTPPADLTLAPPLPINALSKSVPSRLPAKVPGPRAVTGPLSKSQGPLSSFGTGSSARQDGRQSEDQPGDARKRAISASRRQACDLTSRKPRTPVPRSPSTARSHTRSRSTSNTQDATPPWEMAAPPLLYRSPDQKSTTMTPETPRHDDMVIPAVSRRLLAEQLEADDDGLIVEYDKEGRPIRKVPASALDASISRPPDLPDKPLLVGQQQATPPPNQRPVLPVQRVEMWNRPELEKGTAKEAANDLHDSGCCARCTIM